MGKDKLRRFAENETFENVFQPDRKTVETAFEMKGNWGAKFFKNNNPIVLELGCGRGEYTVGLAERFPEVNFIGVDIKGARLWRGAKTALQNNMKNVAFLRTNIELIDKCFVENEVQEIWITFADPQIKYKRAKHRLTHVKFIEKYQHILPANGKIHLKTDSEFLFGYTHGLIEMLGFPVEETYHSIYEQVQDETSVLRTIQTHYEEMWLEMKKTIGYVRFLPNQKK